MKRFISIILLMTIPMLLLISVFAAPVEKDFVYLDSEKDVVFAVEWDVEQPDIVFIAPDGTEYDPMVETEGAVTVKYELSLYYVIYNASNGQWRVRYDKKGNTDIEITVHDYHEGLYIDSFTLGTVDGTKLPVSFHVTGPENLYYNYRITAMINHTGTEKELKNSSARVGRDVDVTLSLRDLSTYSSYILKLYVWYDHEGTDIYDFCFSDPFSFTNTEIDSNVADYDMTVQPLDYLVTVNFPELPWSVDNVLVAIFEDDAQEPSLFDEYRADEVSDIELSYDPAATKVAIEVSYDIDGVKSAPLRKTAILSNFGLSIPTGNSYNSVAFPLGYAGFSKQLVDVTVNGYTTSLVFDADGSVSIGLGDDWNDLQIYYKDSNGIGWEILRKIFVDRIAPDLTMSQPYDGMHVSGSTITISGTTNDCETLTVNGQSVIFDQTGIFSTEVSLNAGNNLITVVASDVLGNQAQYVASITSGEIASADAPAETTVAGGTNLIDAITSPTGYWPLIIAGAICLLLIVYAFIFWRKEEKKK